MIQVYTGNGKGKTTASLGLALRAAGAGLKVYIGQFLKSGCYSEVCAIKAIKNITLEQFGSKCFLVKSPTKKDIENANYGLLKAKKVIASRKFDVVVLDEINVALRLKLFTLKEVLDLISITPKKTELVLTGRNAPLKIIQVADLVSEIIDRKHYYSKGLKARKGIEK